MIGFVLHWLVTAIALAVCARLLPGVHVDTPLALAIAALALGLVNALVRPVLFLLTLPITILTLGLFYLVVNGIAFGLTAWLVPGFEVDGPLAAIVGAIFVSLLSWVLGLLVKRRAE